MRFKTSNLFIVFGLLLAFVVSVKVYNLTNRPDAAPQIVVDRPAHAGPV